MKEIGNGLVRVGLAILTALALWGCTLPQAPAPETEAPDARQEAAGSLEYEEWRTTPPGTHEAYNQRENLIQRGGIVYDIYCVGCHGENGDGKGPASARLITQPRDFTSGIYKFRSTDSSSLPMEGDLYRTITRGLGRVSMPAFPLMPERDKLAVIEYVKSFYPEWEDRKNARSIIPVPRPPEDLQADERRLRGRAVYIEMQCNQCHGIDGQGTGATRTEYVDAWGNPQKPFNFTRGSLKRGNTPEDIYQTFHTGLMSVMPSYGGDTLATATAQTLRGKLEFLTELGLLSEAEADQVRTVADQFPATPDEVFNGMSELERLELTERNSWDLVSYIMDLRPEQTTAAAVLGTPSGETQ